jgi:hypothetical protein
MPKETTYCSADRHYRVDIGWSREAGHVEIAVKTDAASAILSMADHVPDSDTPGVRYDGQIAWNGLHAQLDRTAVNELIRTLRKARDQAYGRDE